MKPLVDSWRIFTLQSKLASTVCLQTRSATEGIGALLNIVKTKLLVVELPKDTKPSIPNQLVRSFLSQVLMPILMQYSELERYVPVPPSLLRHWTAFLKVRMQPMITTGSQVEIEIIFAFPEVSGTLLLKTKFRTQTSV